VELCRFATASPLLRSCTSAGRRNGLHARSASSQQGKKLELELGVELFARTRRGVGALAAAELVDAARSGLTDALARVLATDANVNAVWGGGE